MRNKIFGWIGVVWGGLIVVVTLLHGISGSGAYGSGQVTAVVFGVLMLLAGGWAVRRPVTESGR
jgi:hypothetical protein